jgi:hypothetical protein
VNPSIGSAVLKFYSIVIIATLEPGDTAVVELTRVAISGAAQQHHEYSHSEIIGRGYAGSNGLTLRLS